MKLYKLYFNKEDICKLSITEKFNLIKNNQYLDIFIDDPDCNVRAQVARKGYGLHILVHDKNDWVRRMVAMQGYGLDILINDEDEYVRNLAIMYCKIHPENKECRKILTLVNL